MLNVQGAQEDDRVSTLKGDDMLKNAASPDRQKNK